MEGVAVISGFLTSLVSSGSRCVRGELIRWGRLICHGQGWKGRARLQPPPQHSQLEGGLPSQETWRAGTGTCVRLDLWQVVCSRNLISTSEEHHRLPASCSSSRKATHYLAHRYYLSYFVHRALPGLPRNRCICLESPSAFPKVISKWQNITMHSAPVDSNRENF